MITTETAGTINKKGQVAGNRAFKISEGGVKGPNYAHHMYCTICGTKYHSSQYSKGRAKCPACQGGQGTIIPSGATVSLSTIRPSDWTNSSTDQEKPWPLIKGDAEAADEANDLLGEDAGEDNEGELIPENWTPEDIPPSVEFRDAEALAQEMAASDGITLKADEVEQVPIALTLSMEDVETAASLHRSSRLQSVGADFKPWEELSAAHRQIEIGLMASVVQIFNIDIKGENDDSE